MGDAEAAGDHRRSPIGDCAGLRPAARPGARHPSADFVPSLLIRLQRGWKEEGSSERNSSHRCWAAPGAAAVGTRRFAGNALVQPPQRAGKQLNNSEFGGIIKHLV